MATTSSVLGYRNSSTYPTGKELLLQLGVGRVRMPTPPGFGAPAALLDAHFERSIVKPYEDQAQNSSAHLF